MTVPATVPKSLLKEKSKLSAWPGVDANANAHANANAPKVIFFMTGSQVLRHSKPSGDFLTPPSPPGEKATARQDQAGESGTGYGAGHEPGDAKH